MKQINLKVGEKKAIKSFLFFNDYVQYCGMPNEKTFSIGLREQSGYAGYSINLYFPVSQRILNLNKNTYRIKRVTPDEIVLEY